MERIHTLRTIADELGRDKRTAQSWYTQAKDQHGELGEIEANGTRYFNDAERAILVSFAGADRPSKSAVKVEVESGNHQMILSQPSLPQAYTLEGLRQTEAVTFDDPLAIAAQFLQTADLLVQGMQTDVQKREEKLNQTKQAKDAIAAKANELKLEARFYTERTRNLDTALSTETAALSDALAALQQLGKPAAVQDGSAG